MDILTTLFGTVLAPWSYGDFETATVLVDPHNDEKTAMSNSVPNRINGMRHFSKVPIMSKLYISIVGSVTCACDTDVDCGARCRTAVLGGEVSGAELFAATYGGEELPWP